MTAFAGVSVNSNTLWINCSSVSLKIPLAAPSRINDFTSSTEIKLAVSFSPPPNSLSTRLLDAVRALTATELILARKSIGRATKQAICSEYLSARYLGTNSPRTSDRYEIGNTTMRSAIASAHRAAKENGNAAIWGLRYTRV